MRRYLPFAIRGFVGVVAIFSLILAVLISNQLDVRVARAAVSDWQQAVDLAARTSDFAVVLKNHPNWKATAYNTHNTFQVWHVEFHDGDQDLGSADVSITRQLVYLAHPQAELNDNQRKKGEAAVQKFARNSPAVAAMVGKIPDANTGVNYDPRANVWALYFQQAGEPVAVVVQFQGRQPFDFSQPVFRGLFFPDVLPFADWQKQNQSLAISVADAQPEIAAALRGHDGWTADASYNEDTTWAVNFKVDGKTLASATVDVDTHLVLSFNVTK